jgi:hypothetical protein
VEQHIANGCQGSELDDSKAEKKKTKCNFKNCKKTESIPIICKTCSKTFCLTHRHAEDHKCEALKAPVAQRSQRPGSSTASVKSSRPSGREVLEAAKKKVGASTSGTTVSRGSRQISTRNEAFLNRAQLKFKSVGDANVGVGDRVYFEVLFEESVQTAKSSIAVWLNRNHNVNRAIDVVLRLSKISRQPASDDKSDNSYRLFKETSELDLDQTLADLIQQGSIQDGDKLRLKLS